VRLIPAIDVLNGRCVRLLRGKFDQETVYDVSASELARQYQRMGADWLHIVDLDGARGAPSNNLAMLSELLAIPGLKLQVGGGVRDVGAAMALIEVGVARVVIGSLAVTHPSAVQQLLQRLGPDQLTLALDVRLDSHDLPLVATHGWQQQTSMTLWELVETFAENGLIHVLCTDISRDGALGGPNIALYAEAVRRFDYIDWQASGGVRDARDLQALAEVGVAAAVSGKALLERLFTPEELRPFLPNA
jgi:phosphoribosylformimino-5-aminoimidazole carboxamide ribotide isomerase